MLKIAKKLTQTHLTMVDPLAGDFLRDLTTNTIDTYHFYPSSLFANKGLEIYEDFVQTFLNSHAVIKEEDGPGSLPSYDPYHVGMTEAFPDEELGPTKMWFGWYSNCYIVYTEYPENPNKNSLILAVDNDTYEGVLKYLETPKDIEQDDDGTLS